MDSIFHSSKSFILSHHFLFISYKGINILWRMPTLKNDPVEKRPPASLPGPISYAVCKYLRVCLHLYTVVCVCRHNHICQKNLSYIKAFQTSVVSIQLFSRSHGIYTVYQQEPPHWFLPYYFLPVWNVIASYTMESISFLSCFLKQCCTFYLLKK